MKKDWKDYLHVFVDKAIPICIVLLLFLILGEVLFHDYVVPYLTYIIYLDWTIISIFALDLFLKWDRIRNFPEFLKKSWIDIIAIFPFFLLFRFVEFIGMLSAVSGDIKEAQLIFHEAVELEKVGTKVTKTSRGVKFVRFVRPISRVPRLIKAISFYEEPGNLKVKK